MSVIYNIFITNKELEYIYIYIYKQIKNNNNYIYYQNSTKNFWIWYNKNDEYNWRLLEKFNKEYKYKHIISSTKIFLFDV